MPAHASSTMRGRMRGATSTIVSLAPRARIALRIVNAMNPAPTMTTRLPGAMPATTSLASSSVQKQWIPGPSAPGMGALAAREPVAIRQSSNSTFAPSSRVRVRAAGSRALAFRPTTAFTFHAVSDAGGAVYTWLSEMVPQR